MKTLRCAGTLVVCLMMSCGAYSQSDILIPRQVVEKIVIDLDRYDSMLEEYGVLKEVVVKQDRVILMQDSIVRDIRLQREGCRDDLNNCIDQNLLLSKQNDKLLAKMKRQKFWFTLLVGVVSGIAIIK
jgi:hypothetical protein